jgi:spermidine synthase
VLLVSGLSEMRSARPATTARLAAVCFFVSGGAGLVYQVVWSRMLGEIFGISVNAVTAVLATYLGGLALGAWLLGRVADRTRSPLRLYAFLELGVAAAAAAGMGAAALLEPVHLRLAAVLPPDSVLLFLARIALALVVVLPATVSMGATLPAMARFFCGRISELGRELGGLYALNTAGAVAGCLLAGFFLVRAVGVRDTLWIAAGSSVAVALVAFALSARERGTGPSAEPERAADGPERDATRAIPIALTLAGFASLYLEVVWTRMLVLVLGTTTYAFVTMLATFLVGIALGGAVARSWIDRLRDPRRAFGILQLAIAGITLATLPGTRALLEHGATLWLDEQASSFGLIAQRFGVAFAVMLLPTMLIGASFPLAVRVATRRIESLAGRIGELYAANTLGNIAGAALGGFVLLPALGMQRSIGVVAALNLAAAACAFAAPRGRLDRARASWALAAIAAGSALIAIWRPAPLPHTAGTPQDPLLFYQESLVSTVAVFQQAYDGARRVMSADGVAIGQSSAGLDRKQQVLAHLPFVLSPEGAVKSVLSIGLGTGILAAEAARHPGVERVDVVELSSSVVEGARLFAEYNDGIPDHPRVHVRVDDGVLHLRSSRARYDAIIADGKSRSGHAGNAVFYSADFYRLARAHLAPGGAFVQWVPFDLTPADVRTLVRTFVRSFPHSYAWLGDAALYLHGQDHPLQIDSRRLGEVLAKPATAHLARHGWVRGEEAVAMLIGDGPGIEPWIADGDAVNSVDHPILEFFSLTESLEPERRRVAENLAAVAALRARGLSDVRIDAADAEELRRAREAVGFLLDGLLAADSEPERAERELVRAAELAPQGGIIRRMAAEAIFEIGREFDVRGLGGDALARYARAIELWPPYLEAHLNAAQILAIRGRARDAENLLMAALERHPRAGAAHRMLGKLLLARGDAAGSLGHLREAERLSAPDAELSSDLGLALMQAGDHAGALERFQEVLRMRPDWAAALSRVAVLLAMAPDPALRHPQEAIRLARVAVERAPDDASLHEALGVVYAATGDFDSAVEAQEAALRIALSAGDEGWAAQIRRERDRYRRREPSPGLKSEPPAP